MTVTSTTTTLPRDLVEKGVPEGWVTCRAGDIATVVGGGTPKASDPGNFADGGHPWLTPADLAGDPPMYVERGRRDLSDEGLKSSSAKPMPAGTVLMSSRAPIGYVAIAAGQISTNQGFRSFVLPKGVVSEYLYYWLKYMRPIIEGMGSGSTFAEISGSRCKEIPVLVPPTAEQKRIAGAIRDLEGRLAGARQRLVRASNLMADLRQSVLAAAASGELTAGWRSGHPDVPTSVQAIEQLRESARTIKVRRGVPTEVNMPNWLAATDLPATWSLVSVAGLLRSGALIDLKDGNHGANHPKKDEFTSVGLPFITAAQVRDFRIDYDGAPKVAGEVHDRLRVGFAAVGDALLTHKGSVGRSALNTERCVLTPQTTYYRCNDQVLDARWLVYLFASPAFYRQLAAVMSQTTRDFVPIREQYRLFIAVPPLEEQREIVRLVDEMFELVDSVERRVQEAAGLVESALNAALAAAFRGELVPTEAELAAAEGRDYESAEELLDRINSAA